jgi:hypothetical protein
MEELNSILSEFKGNFIFHNYTRGFGTIYKQTDVDENEGSEEPPMEISDRKTQMEKFAPIHELRRILTDFSAQKLPTDLVNQIPELNDWVLINIVGSSFLLNQIRKMIGMALGVSRNLVPREAVKVSLTGPFKLVVPTVPSKYLYLYDSHLTTQNFKRQLFPNRDTKLQEFRKTMILPHILKIHRGADEFAEFFARKLHEIAIPDWDHLHDLYKKEWEPILIRKAEKRAFYDQLKEQKQKGIYVTYVPPKEAK